MKQLGIDEIVVDDCNNSSFYVYFELFADCVMMRVWVHQRIETKLIICRFYTYVTPL